jgi:hypothetical protein
MGAGNKTKIVSVQMVLPVKSRESRDFACAGAFCRKPGTLGFFGQRHNPETVLPEAQPEHV